MSCWGYSVLADSNPLHYWSQDKTVSFNHLLGSPALNDLKLLLEGRPALREWRFTPIHKFPPPQKKPHTKHISSKSSFRSNPKSQKNTQPWWEERGQGYMDISMGECCWKICSLPHSLVGVHWLVEIAWGLGEACGLQPNFGERKASKEDKDPGDNLRE